MTSLKKYDLSGEVIGEVVLEEGLVSTEAVSAQMTKDYILAIRRNKRQWSANTKGRSEIQATGKKPFAQKGTGNARQGCIVVSQYRGGAVVFGPKPKFNQRVRINKKERRKVIASLLSEKILASSVCVLSVSGMDLPKTRTAAHLLKTLGMDSRVLLLGKHYAKEEDSASRVQCRLFAQSMRNIPSTEFLPALSVSGYDLMKSNKIIVMDDAIDDLMAILRRVV